ncbi:DUF459 domain-containing protein [Moraxella sp. ZY210820]|uniref:SGNH/GDSL hydrolase family protein n=1 Tax=Moraxella sp. ZY210820 TaxID=2904123 RepID=UPI0027304294|nr:DUF459 domain-containing protein [Moraxella sp. ZY210820]WLF84742.1 DUF459 domain-containing protein [Moraxella sp. ZY210820]
MQTSKLPIHLAMMEQLKSKQGKLRFRFRFGNEQHSVLAQNKFVSVYFPIVQIGKQFYRVQAITDYTTEPLMNVSVVRPKNISIVSSAKEQSTQVPVVKEALPSVSHLFTFQNIRVVAPQMKGLSVLATEVVTIVDDMRIMKFQPILQSDGLIDDEISSPNEKIEIIDSKTVSAHYTTQAINVIDDVIMAKGASITELVQLNEQDDVTTTQEIVEQDDNIETLVETVEYIEQEITEIMDDKNDENLLEDVQLKETVIETVDTVELEEVKVIEEIIEQSHEYSADTTEEIIQSNDENTVEKSIEDIRSEQSVVETIDNVEQEEVKVIEESIEQGHEYSIDTTEEIIQSNDENTVEKSIEDIRSEQSVVETIDNVEQEEIKVTEEIIQSNDENTQLSAMAEQSFVLLSTKTVESETNYQSTLKKCAKVGGILLAFAVLNIWVMQRSVNAYYLQTYHQPSPLVKLDDVALWSLGAKIGDFLYAQHDTLTSGIQQANQKVVDNFNQNHAFTAEYLAEQEQKRQAQLAQLKLEQEKQAKEQLAQRYMLTPNDKIFFAGDSMMQGVAPHVQQYLQKHNIQSINLSKQSTGLSYPSFFDWPKTIEQTLQQNSDIKILAIFLGPNDPWNIVHPQTKQLLKFASSEWQAEYQSRMLSILNVAKQHQVSVIWLTSPNMKDDKLNRQMIDLNKIMNDELRKHDDVLAIDTRALLGSQNDVYNDYLVKDGQSIKMRTGDGVHFTPQGQKNVAQALQKHLTIMP